MADVLADVSDYLTNASFIYVLGSWLCVARVTMIQRQNKSVQVPITDLLLRLHTRMMS